MRTRKLRREVVYVLEAAILGALQASLSARLNNRAGSFLLFVGLLLGLKYLNDSFLEKHLR